VPKISQASVSRLQPAATDVFLWDSKLPGFGVRVKKKTGVRSFVIQYRNGGGQSRRYTIARYGVMTPDEARREAKILLASVAKGRDPAAEGAAARSAPTVAELAHRFIAEHAEAHKKPSSVKEDRRLIAARITPRLGSTKVATVTRADVSKLHHRLRDTPYEANRTLALLSKMFNLAEVWGMRPDGSNPCRHVKRFKEGKRERFFAGDEFARIGAVVGEADQSGSILPGVSAAIRLLALTGCRMGEVLSLRWAYVDIANAVLRLPDAKAGARVVALGAPAVAFPFDAGA
jgi:integrase